MLLQSQTTHHFVLLLKSQLQLGDTNLTNLYFFTLQWSYVSPLWERRVSPSEVGMGLHQAWNMSFYFDWIGTDIGSLALSWGQEHMMSSSVAYRETNRFFHLCIKSSVFWLVPAPAMLSGSPSPFHFIVGKCYHSGWLPCAVAGNLLCPVVILQGHFILVAWPLLDGSQLVSFFFLPHFTSDLLYKLVKSDQLDTTCTI